MGEASARGILELTGEALEQAIRERAAIRAYHGSPHVFDKFSLDKIGSGEGAQVYGHGLYFTESEGIGKGYREKLAGKPREKALALDDYPIWTNAHGNSSEWDEIDRELLRRNGDDLKAADYLAALPPEARAIAERMIHGTEAERTAWGHLSPVAQELVQAGTRKTDNRGRILITRGGTTTAWDDRALENWKRLEELAPNVDHNVVHDAAAYHHYATLRRGLLELHARAHFVPADAGALGRIRDDLNAEIRGLTSRLDDPLAGDRERMRFALKEKHAALYTLDHYGKRLSMLPPETPGAMYEVAIKAHPDTFLLWDKPVKDQSPQVRRALGVRDEDLERLKTLSGQLAEVDKGIGRARLQYPTGPEKYEHPPAPRDQYGQSELDRLENERDRIERELRTFQPALERTGRDAYERLAAEHKRAGPTKDWGTFPDPAAAARALREKGITGIKYLDGFSRGAGEGTHNYVVFDDQAIDILKRYGLAGLMAGGAAGAYGQAGAGDVTVQHAGPGRKALETGARKLAGLFDEAPAALKDVALPGLEAVRETENALPELELPFSLTSEAATRKGKQGTLLGAAAAGGALAPMPSHEARIRSAAALAPMRPMPSHGGQGGSTLDPSWQGAERIGPEPAARSPEPYIVPPGLFDKGTSRLSDFLAAPAPSTRQRFPLDEAIELSGIGDPSQHVPAAAATAALTLEERIRRASALRLAR